VIRGKYFWFVERFGVAVYVQGLLCGGSVNLIIIPGRAASLSFIGMMEDDQGSSVLTTIG
jgi:hypothetical protein